MKNLICEIKIGNFVFNYDHMLTIQDSWDTFTGTASITLPNRFRKKDGQTLIVGTENVFKRGDSVTIKIGYFPNLETRFEGFITLVKPDSPVVLECEDEMWQVKQVNLASKEFTNTTVKTVVDFAMASFPDTVIEFDDPDANIGSFHIDNKGFINAVTVFEVLKRQFGYNIFFQGKVLQVRVLKSILALDRPVHRFGLQRNIISDDLKYQRDDDQDMMIRFESKQDDDTVLTFFGFKENGETVITTNAKFAGVTHSWNVPDLSETQIRRIMLDNIDDFIWEGYSGSFLTFLEPSVQKADRVDLIDKEHPEREGRYLIKSVDTTFGVSGARQSIELRNRIL